MPKRTTIAIGIALILAPLFCRASDEGMPAGGCRVVVTSESIISSFPTFRAPLLWRWHRASTQDNALEYRWQVEFGERSPQGSFERSEYAFALELFKFPDDPERSGEFAELLRAMQGDLLRTTGTPGGYEAARVQDVKVTGEQRPGLITIHAHGGDVVRALTSTKPAHALLSTIGPEFGPLRTCYATVEYK